jgi:hypothetical protein
MHPREGFRRLLVASALAASGWTVSAAGSPGRPDLTTLVDGIGERLAEYYRHAQQLVCLERSTVTPIDSSWRLDGFARTVESELRLDIDETAAVREPRVTREIRRVNGREPRERDRKNRAGCTDPTPLSPEPLAFLLPERRDEYLFTAVREVNERNRAAFAITFSSVRSQGHPELIQDEGGHDDCFDWKGPVAITGRVWVDAATLDVLRLERRVAGPTDLRVPMPLQRRYLFTPFLTMDRDDLTVRYKEVTFDDPAETVLLPESIESLTVFRGGLQSMRRTQLFTDYRRFLTSGRIK